MGANVQVNGTLAGTGALYVNGTLVLNGPINFAAADVVDLASEGDLIIDPQGTYGAQAPACGNLSDCQGNANTVPTGSSVATSTTTTGTITATGTGVGAITVGRYASNPVGAPTFNAAGSYFDVRTSDANSFSGATIEDCDLLGAVSLQWWDPSADAGAGAWQPVSPESYSAGPPACLTVNLSATSSPTLAQLVGTVFAGALPASSAPAFTADSPPLTATAGTVYSYNFAASGAPAPTYALVGAPTWLSVDTGTGGVSGTPPTGTTSFSYSVTASNGVAPNATAGPYTVTVAAATATAAPIFTLDSPPLTATTGTQYSYGFAASGAPTPTFSLKAGPRFGWASTRRRGWCPVLRRQGRPPSFTR